MNVYCKDLNALEFTFKMFSECGHEYIWVQLLNILYICLCGLKLMADCPTSSHSGLATIQVAVIIVLDFFSCIRNACMIVQHLVILELLQSYYTTSNCSGIVTLIIVQKQTSFIYQLITIIDFLVILIHFQQRYKKCS